MQTEPGTTDAHGVPPTVQGRCLYLGLYRPTVSPYAVIVAAVFSVAVVGMVALGMPSDHRFTISLAAASAVVVAFFVAVILPRAAHPYRLIVTDVAVYVMSTRDDRTIRVVEIRPETHVALCRPDLLIVGWVDRINRLAAAWRPGMVLRFHADGLVLRGHFEAEAVKGAIEQAKVAGGDPSERPGASAT